MQTIKRLNKNVHSILDDIDQLYEYLSEHSDTYKNQLVAPTFDNSFSDLVDTFIDYGINDTNFTSENYEVNFTDVPYEPLEVPDSGNNLILSFSGGRDSVASALKYKEMGYNVYLYHLKHINPAVSDEWVHAEKLAELLGLPIFVDTVKLSGHHVWMEHPMKNMMIANGALSYGIREGIGTRLAFGNYTTSLLPYNSFDRCAGDCVDMWERYSKIIQRIIPDFEIYNTLENLGETLDIITKRMDLLENALSCMCRHSLRPYRHSWVKSKYGIDLLENRCGSCFKCCVEYIYLADHDLIEFSEDYYKYCLNQLFKVSRAEDLYLYSIENLWVHYLFYPIEQSKLYGTFDRVVVLRENIKWA